MKLSIHSVRHKKDIKFNLLDYFKIPKIIFERFINTLPSTYIHGIEIFIIWIIRKLVTKLNKKLKISYY